MITIKKVSAYVEGECNCCYPLKPAKKKDKVFAITFEYNPLQAMRVHLCKDHLEELARSVEDALDPPYRSKA